VDSTSQLPISPTAAALTVGSEAITAGLMGAGSRVEVIAQLQPDLDHPSGYVWAGGRYGVRRGCRHYAFRSNGNQAAATLVLRGAGP
jgi:hypothetical protein